MIEILKSIEVFNTPQGKAICGAYSQSDGKRPLSEVLEEMSKKSKDMKYITYKTHSGNYNSLKIKDIQYTTSIGDGVNLFFLLGNINLPEEIKEGTTIYRA